MMRDQYGRPWRDLRLSIMDRCPFRCPYCMPESDYPEGFRFLSPHERLSVKEMVAIAQSAVACGVRKIRLTGGEPLLHPQILELVEALAALEGVDDLALTTNGILLPRLAKSLKEAGLQRVTVSLDALTPALFAHMSGGRGTVKSVLMGIEAAREANFPQGIKINTVVQRGVNEAEIVPLAAYGITRDIVVRFIEYMDVGTRNGWQRHDVVSADEIKTLLEEGGPLAPLESHYHGEVAQRYHYCGQKGEIGIIASVTQPFCGACSRARVSSEGYFYTCLFASEGTDLRTVLRQQGAAGVEAVLQRVWSERSDRYSAQRSHQKNTNAFAASRIEMNYIGG